MRVDLLTLQDLIQYQKIDFSVIGGIYWTGKRDLTIRSVIKRLFEERARYKKEGNSIQTVLKLIMNSSYGKSIQKTITSTEKFVPAADYDRFMCRHWHRILEISDIMNSQDKIFKLQKSTLTQFNNCLFGVSVLSMSKRIMNEVMTLAEDLDIKIYYQDTDSMHIEHSKLPLLAQRFEELHRRPLIGENVMGCFHNDFDELPDSYAIEHISLGKKCYYDLLTNHTGAHAEHFRMKGIPNNVIVNHAKEHFNNSVRDLYLHLYKGGNIKFDLTSCAVRFDMKRSGEILHKNEFVRNIEATAPLAK